MKKCVVQIVRAPAGGIRKHIVDILENINQKDYQSIFISNFNESDLDLKYLEAQYKVEFFHIEIKEAPSFKDLINFLTIKKFLRNKNVDIVHGHGAKGGLYARLLKLCLPVKTVYTPHGGSLHRVHGVIKNFLYDRIEKFLMSYTDKFIFESEYSKSMFLKNVIDPGSKAVVNLNGIAIPRQMVDKVYQPGTELKLASFGLFRKLKGHDIVIEACALLKKNSIKFRYDIYGEGEYLSPLRKIIIANGLNDSVTLKPYVKEVENVMREYDFVIHPSRFESFGYVPVEAMALGIPVITSNVGGLREVVSSETGLINKSNTPEIYAEILIRAYRGEIDLETQVHKARERVENKFSLHSMISGLEQIYTDL